MKNEPPRVFVSYTAEDLIRHAEAVLRAVRRFQWIAVDHRDWAATGRPSVQECRERVEGCDVLIVLVAQRYGWVPTRAQGGDGERSITWIEVETARRRGLAVLPFIVRDEANWPLKHVDALTRPEVARLLESFKAMLRESVCAFFHDETDLETRVVEALREVELRLREARVPARAVGDSASGLGAGNRANEAGKQEAGIPVPIAETIKRLAEDLKLAGPARQRAVLELVQLGGPAVPQLVSLLADKSKGVRRAAAEALRGVGPTAVSELVAALGRDGLRDGAVPILAEMGRAAVHPVIPLLREESGPVRDAAIDVLRRIGPEAGEAAAELAVLINGPVASRSAAEALTAIGPAAVPCLVDLLADSPEYTMTPRSVDVLASIGRPAVPALVDALGDDDPITRKFALRALNRIGSGFEQAVPDLLQLLRARDPMVVLEAGSALKSIGLPAVAPLIEMLSDRTSDVANDFLNSMEARGVLRSIGQAAVPQLAEALEIDDKAVRIQLARCLGEIGKEAAQAIPALAQLLEQEQEDEVREIVTQALDAIRDESKQTP